MAVLVISSAQTGWGDQFSLAPVSPATDDPNWLLGPAKASLADFATIDVPEGCRFTDARGARVLLQRMKNPVPQNLVGILAPESGKWWVVLDWSEVGYVKDLSRESSPNAGSVLKAMRARLAFENARRVKQGAQPIVGVDWAMEPVFDASRYTLEWAIRAETRIEKVVNLQEELETNSVINHTMRLIGKRRVVGLTGVQSDQTLSEAVPLTDLVKTISFNTGERYADHQAGDKLAKLSLEQLIAGEEVKTASSPYARWGIWIGAGFVTLVAVVAGCVIAIRRKLRQFKMSRAFPEYREHEHPLSPIFGSGKGVSGNGARRRRSFNYQKFYSDMMLEVSAGPLVLHPAPNGKRVAPPTTERVSPMDRPVNELVVRVNMELIANQNHLIEEQKRLLQEQRRLIEEKSKLIHEKTELLEKQAELLERDLV